MKKLFKIVSAVLIVVLMFSLSACGKKSNVYKVTVAAPINGSVTADKTEVARGGEVTLTVTPDKDYYLKELSVNGKAVAGATETFTICDVSENITVTATFAYAKIEVSFDTGTGESVAPVTVTYGRMYGVLPTLGPDGARTFIGWTYGGNAVKSDTVVTEKTAHTLTAAWRELPEEEFPLRTPYSLTVMYYDVNALSLGVSFHTEAETFMPVLQLSEGTDFNEKNCKTFSATVTEWETEYVNQTVVNTLEFGKTYTYRVGDAALGVYSDTYTFTTRSGGAASSFIYVSDTQQTLNNAATGIAVSDWAKMMEEADARFDFDFIVNGGDMVNYGAEKLTWKEVLGDLAPYLGSYPLVFSMGNHECNDWYAAGISSLFQMMFNVKYPQQAGAENGAFYSLDIGALHLIVLRSNDFNLNEGQLTQEQIEWFKADVAADKANEDTVWRVIVMHEGIVVPVSQTPTSTVHMSVSRKPLMKLFREAEIDLVLYGHEHYSTVSVPLDYLDDDNADLDGDGYPDYVQKVNRQKTETVNEDGEAIYSYDHYVSGQDGTVFHEVGTGGRQYSSAFPYDEAEQWKEKWVYYEELHVGGAGKLFADDNRAFSFYDYVQVDEHSLTVRNYAFNYAGFSSSGEAAKFVYGFRLNKS